MHKELKNSVAGAGWEHYFQLVTAGVNIDDFAVSGRAKRATCLPMLGRSLGQVFPSDGLILRAGVIKDGLNQIFKRTVADSM